ncbi:MAG: haloalkane dehalogenase [Mycobacteriales bacterium]
MHILRTPEERFARLGFGYEPRYLDVPAGDGRQKLRVAYVQDGPDDGPVVLCLHGEPTWSYLYRKVLPVLAAAGARAIALDLVGFGRSDKPAEVGDHSYADHVEWVRAAAFDALDLHGITLLGQDWGGLIGLRLVAEHTERFARVVAANTGLPTGDQAMPDEWLRFRDAVDRAQELDIARFVKSGCVRGLTEADQAAYDAPFPDETYKAGPRAMPGLVPTRPDDPASEANRAAWLALTKLELPFLCAFSDSDPITRAMGPILARVVPGAAGRAHPTIKNAGHFLQEDAGVELGRVVAEFLTAT